MVIRPHRQELWHERLEREGNDDFALLEEVGPVHFTADHLQEMRELISFRLAQFDKVNRLNMWFGASTVLWVVGAFAGLALGYRIAILLACLGLVISLSAFVTGIVLLKVRFESRGNLEYTLSVIDEELRRRGTRKQSGAPRK